MQSNPNSCSREVDIGWKDGKRNLEKVLTLGKGMLLWIYVNGMRKFLVRKFKNYILTIMIFLSKLSQLFSSPSPYRGSLMTIGRSIHMMKCLQYATHCVITTKVKVTWAIWIFITSTLRLYYLCREASKALSRPRRGGLVAIHICKGCKQQFCCKHKENQDIN